MSEAHQRQPLTPDAHDFLRYWTDAAQAAGWNLFNCRGLKPEQISHWREVTPNIKEMHKAVMAKPTHQGALIAAMASLYNVEEGAKMAKKVGLPTMGHLISALKTKDRHTIGSLIIFQQEW